MAKDLGTRLEQRIGTAVLDLHPSEVTGLVTDPRDDASGARFAESIVYSPVFTLRGGTNEILRTIVAKRYLATGRRVSGNGRPDEASARLLRADPELEMLHDTAMDVFASSKSADETLREGAALGWFSSFVPVEHGGREIHRPSGTWPRSYEPRAGPASTFPSPSRASAATCSPRRASRTWLRRQWRAPPGRHAGRRMW